MVYGYFNTYNDILYGDCERLLEIFNKFNLDDLVINDNDSEEVIRNLLGKLKKNDTLVIRNIGSLGSNLEKAISRLIKLLDMGVKVKILHISAMLSETNIKKSKALGDVYTLSLLRSLLKDCMHFDLYEKLKN